VQLSRHRSNLRRQCIYCVCKGTRNKWRTHVFSFSSLFFIQQKKPTQTRAKRTQKDYHTHLAAAPYVNHEYLNIKIGFRYSRCASPISLSRSSQKRIHSTIIRNIGQSSRIWIIITTASERSYNWWLREFCGHELFFTRSAVPRRFHRHKHTKYVVPQTVINLWCFRAKSRMP